MRNEGAGSVTERESQFEDESWARDGGVGRDRRPVRGRVLVIEAQAESGRLLLESLTRADFSVRLCADAPSGLHAFLSELPDLIVMRACGTGAESLELLLGIREISDVPMILLERESAQRDRGVFVGGLGFDRVFPAAADGDEIAGWAAQIVAGRDGGTRRDSEDGSLTSVGSSRRLTAAQVRRLARSDLEAELERQLVDCRGNLAEMARRMGKDRSTIRYHLRRFGMLVEDRSIRPERARSETPASKRPPV